jgi:1-deoxyxylulose-5-phosphate synthase
MDYRLLGRTGIKVSSICLGMMSFGNSREWTLEIDAARPIIDRAIDAGINFFDTANVYATGRSEEITGELLKEHRDDIVLATKIMFAMSDGVNDKGLNRYHMTREIKNSLKRLQTDFIDLYQIHRWDYATDVEYIMRSLNQLIDNGEVLHIGASSMFAWQLSKAQYTAEKLGLEGFSTMQNHYNPIYREEEREMIPLCIDMNLGIMPWSPLARGQVTRPIDTSTTRKESDSLQQTWYNHSNDNEIINEIEQIAKELDVSMAQVSLSWVLQQPGITSPIIGVTKISHLEDAIAAIELRINQDYIKRISEKYTSRPIAGHSYKSLI